jgi:hypothetical protein
MHTQRRVVSVSRGKPPGLHCEAEALSLCLAACGSEGRDPLGALAGDCRNPVVVLVVMPQDGAREFGRRRDDQVRDLYTSVMQTANVGKFTLDFVCVNKGFGVDSVIARDESAASSASDWSMPAPEAIRAARRVRAAVRKAASTVSFSPVVPRAVCARMSSASSISIVVRPDVGCYRAFL